MKDRTILILLLAICLGLWANLLSPWITVSAQESRGYTLQSAYLRLLSMQTDLTELKREVAEVQNSLTELKTGSCRNPKIC